MKHPSLLTSLMLTVLLSTSCTETDLTVQPADDAALPAWQQSAAGGGHEALVFRIPFLDQRLDYTRAGTPGIFSAAKLKTDGFGVFGYYTHTEDYAQNTEPNIMYNQRVTWTRGYAAAADSAAPCWSYEPLSYWPADVAGGKVSFFAYAPYVALPLTAASTGDGLSSGIVAINSVTTLQGTRTDDGITRQGDPTLTYVLADRPDDAVDLLWGTACDAGPDGTETTRSGVTGNKISSSPYTRAILDGYSVNANLTRQKTEGAVSFAFKHALACVGGAQDDAAGRRVAVQGMTIGLDLDDAEGNDSGGKLEPIYNTDSDHSWLYEEGRTEFRTKVTVTEVAIEARSLTADGTVGVGGDGYVRTYLKQNEGVFDLATGRWTLTGATTTDARQAATTTHNITSPLSTLTPADATLSADIAETGMGTHASTMEGFKALPLGVLVARQNVYDGPATPLLFIPGTWPELTVSILYTVRTFDAKLDNMYSEVVQRVTQRVTFDEPVELNKQYSLLIRIGLSAVKFTATASDWEPAVTAAASPESGEVSVTVEPLDLPGDVAP